MDSAEYRYFTQDVARERIYQWLSIFWQVNEPVRNPAVKSVLEFGPGRGLTKAIMAHYGINHVAVDAVAVSPQGFVPDVLAPIADFESGEKFDMVCAFQVLEHNPTEKLETILSKFYKLTNRYVYLSLPYNGRWFSLALNWFLPKLNVRFFKTITVDRVFKKLKPIEEYRKRADLYNPHWWEVGDKNMTRKDIRKLFKSSGFTIQKEFHCQTYPHHLFYLLEKEMPEEGTS